MEASVDDALLAPSPLPRLRSRELSMMSCRVRRDRDGHRQRIARDGGAEDTVRTLSFGEPAVADVVALCDASMKPPRDGGSVAVLTGERPSVLGTRDSPCSSMAWLGLARCLRTPRARARARLRFAQRPACLGRRAGATGSAAVVCAASSSGPRCAGARAHGARARRRAHMPPAVDGISCSAPRPALAHRSLLRRAGAACTLPRGGLPAADDPDD